MMCSDNMNSFLEVVLPMTDVKFKNSKTKAPKNVRSFKIALEKQFYVDLI